MEQPSDFQDARAQAASIASMLGDTAPTRLPHVVILPQRRPKQRARGFVRAYAPDLNLCGIDQTTFMAFVDGLNEAVASHPLLGAINVAGQAVGAIPSTVLAVAPVIGLSVQLAAGVYTEMQARKSQNAYIMKMNDELFRPHGLYCLIMAYDTNSRSNFVQHDLGVDTGAPILDAPQSQDTFRSNDGIMGAMEFPVSAELVYLGPNDAPLVHDAEPTDDSDGESRGAGGIGFSGLFAKTVASLNARKDLKSQVKFQRKNPTSAINPLLDPSATLTPKDQRKQEKRETKQEKKWEKQERKSEKRQRKHPEREPRQRKIRQGILYLMIVNMPSVDDMNAAHRLIGT